MVSYGQLLCCVINNYVIILFVTCSYAVIVKGYKGCCTQLALEISRTFLTSTIKVLIFTVGHYIESVPRRL